MTAAIIILASLAGYLALTMVTARAALIARMSEKACQQGNSREHCREYHPRNCWATRGAVGDRRLYDAWIAMCIGAAWFVTLPMIGVFKGTPLTGGELTRVNKEQADRIKDIQAELDEMERERTRDLMSQARRLR